jgi:hypothetical protein
MTIAKLVKNTKQISIFKNSRLIKNSESPFIALLLYVLKYLLPNRLKKHQMVINSRALNEVTVKYYFPLLLVHDLMEKP